MTTVGEVLALRSVDPAGLSRTMKWSFGVHVGAVLMAFILPSSWLAKDRSEPNVMTVSLGAGTPGEDTGGMTAVGRRAVEEAVPPPPRPLPVTPATSRPNPTTSAAATLPPPPDAPPRPRAATQSPPATGAQVQTGTSAAETGATQDSTGLSFGGEGGQAMVSADFCCPWYFDQMKQAIIRLWRSDLPGVRGATVIQYTISRDGTIAPESIQILQSSGTTGDIAARRALQQVRLNPIPSQAEENEIVVRLTFPYGQE